jgi:MFS family permease
MRPLVLHRFFLRFALAGASVFAWIFLLQYFYILSGDLALALARTALLYALSSIVTSLATPLTARLLRHGSRRALVFALTSIGSAFVILGAAFEGYWSDIPAAIALFAVLLGLYRALYWVSYEVEATTTPAKRRSRGTEILIALAPALGGLFIAGVTMAPVWLFYIAAAFVTLSALPLFYAQDVPEKFSWGYRETFHELLSREHRTVVTHAILEGMSGAALLLFWPLAAFLLLGWSYGTLGIVLSLTFLVAIFVRVPVRMLLRRTRLHESQMLSTVFAVTPWLFRLVIASPLSIISVDSYFYTTTPRRLGVDPFTFEQASDGGSLVDEYTALKEIALNIGRVTICVLGAAAALMVSVPFAFLVVFCAAAVASATLALKGR